MKLLYIVIISVLFSSCSADSEKSISDKFYLNKFFCRNMSLLALNTYQNNATSVQNSQIRSLSEDIILDSNNLKFLTQHSKVVISIMDSLIDKKAYLLNDYDLHDKIEIAKRDMKSKSIGQMYNGLYVGMEVIVSLSFFHFCGFGQDRLGLFITDSIILDSNQLFAFDFDIRPQNSNMIYYNTYSKNDSINKTKIFIDTRNIDSDRLIQNITASITNPITLETKTYQTPIIIKIKR